MLELAVAVDADLVRGIHEGATGVGTSDDVAGSNVGRIPGAARLDPCGDGISTSVGAIRDADIIVDAIQAEGPTNLARGKAGRAIPTGWGRRVKESGAMIGAVVRAGIIRQSKFTTRAIGRETSSKAQRPLGGTAEVSLSTIVTLALFEGAYRVIDAGGKRQ